MSGGHFGDARAVKSLRIGGWRTSNRVQRMDPLEAALRDLNPVSGGQVMQLKVGEEDLKSRYIEGFKISYVQSFALRPLDSLDLLRPSRPQHIESA